MPQLKNQPDPSPAPAARKKSAGPVLWYSWDYATPALFSPPALQACGVTAALLVSALKFDPQNRSLGLDELRRDAQALRGYAGPLPVWWGFSTVRQAGNPTPSSPARTLCDPRDAAARTMLLDNYASIGRVCKEVGFAGLALDSEDFGGAGLAWPDEPGARELGADLARACRQNNGTLPLAAFGPVSGAPAGFQKVWRGFFGAAGRGAAFFNEDAYGIARVDVKRLLAQTRQVTGCDTPALAWWPEGNAAAVPGYIGAAGAQVRAARQGGRPIMLYHEHALDSAGRAALAAALNGG